MNLKKIFSNLIFVSSLLISATPEVLRWEDGLTFTHFLEREGLPHSIYKNADNDDKKGIEGIQAGDTYYILREDNGTVLQALIPISEELQAHIRKNGDEYIFQNIPIDVQELEGNFVIKLTGESVYSDIEKATGSPPVARAFARAFENSIDFEKDIYENTILSMIYRYKMRLGRPFGKIEVQVATIQTGKKKKYIINYKSELYGGDSEMLKPQESYKLTLPMRLGSYRVTSHFTKKRWHPILHKYRAHLGTDFAGQVGTPILSAGDGLIVYAGVSSGYGNVVKIKHRDGYLTLYAHLLKFNKIRTGNKVKRGEHIAFLGNSGLSTGPHLHFGLYKDGNAIDPETLINASPIKYTVNLEFKDTKNKLIKNINNLITRWKSRNYNFLKFSDTKLSCETGISNNSKNNNELEHANKQINIFRELVKDGKTSDGKKIKIRLFSDDSELELSEDLMSE